MLACTVHAADVMDHDGVTLLLSPEETLAQFPRLAHVWLDAGYNGTGKGKDWIDWASRPYGDSAWNGKPAAIMGASPGAIGTARAQYHLRQILVYLNMFPINQPELMICNAAARFDKEGNLTDDTTQDFSRQLLQNLVEWTRRLGQP